jgi:hypothetical protein
MKRNHISQNAVPDWFLETVQVTQHVYGGVRNIELELRQALELNGVDSRLRNELEHTLDALAAVKGSLALLEMTAGDVIRGIAGNTLSGPKSPAVQ